MFSKPFSQISRKDTAIAGGKGASLGEMTRAKIPVPPGFVILTPAFAEFLRKTDINIEINAALDKVNTGDINSIDQASRVIRSLIENAKVPASIQEEVKREFKKLGAKYVAVRSSATAEDSKAASWAGELDTFLNTTEQDLLKNIRKCWSSLFTQRAIFYRFEKKLHQKGSKECQLFPGGIGVAVVIQQMVESEIAGITFTVHPVTRDKNQMIIEAAWGLGEAIVSGQVTPDSYVIHKKDKCLVDVNVSEQTKMLSRQKTGNGWVAVSKNKLNKQKLTNEKIMELAEICIKIEKHYKFPCDIEWAFARNKFYITQSRPITTL